jgi:hypothetical protein
MQVAAKTQDIAPTPPTSEARPSTSDIQDKPAQPAPGPGPAATVDISAQSKALLRAAGVSGADAAKVNLKDSGAVAAAVKHAKAARFAGGGHKAVAAYAAVASKASA